jgi:hypothetical protein
MDGIIAAGAQRPEWVPSQNGLFPVRLQQHRAYLFFSSTLKALGEKPVPAWEPSQNGWFAEPPQVQ